MLNPRDFLHRPPFARNSSTCQRIARLMAALQMSQLHSKIPFRMYDIYYKIPESRTSSICQLSPESIFLTDLLIVDWRTLPVRQTTRIELRTITAQHTTLLIENELTAPPVATHHPRACARCTNSSPCIILDNHESSCLLASSSHCLRVWYVPSLATL